MRGIWHIRLIAADINEFAVTLQLLLEQRIGRIDWTLQVYLLVLGLKLHSFPALNVIW
jgi:hypothetical protein